ncbi:MAG: hypothetical protein ABI895_35950 [Deltaproteobacteria bacterium]
MTIRWARVSFALLAAASAIGACSVDRADVATSPCTGLSCRDDMSEGAATDLAGTAATPDASAPSNAPRLLKVACGGGSCVPDDSRACASSAPPTQVTGGGGAVDAGTGSPDAGSEGLDAGLDDGGRDPRVDGSFSRPTPQEPAPSAFACQLTRTGNDAVKRECVPAGVREIDEACTSSLDCRPGLGCVGGVRSGRCLPYCCGIDGDTCETGYYCAQRPLRSPELGEADGPLVPVCDRAEGCSLGEPANCTGEHCLCAAGTVCSVVRPDGTRACVIEGPGSAGDPCPCKWGYHCSQATSPATCVKTCELNTPDSCSGVCQSTPLLPEGWGTCVDAYPEPKP